MDPWFRYRRGGSFASHEAHWLSLGTTSMGLSIDICFATRAEVEGRIWWERNESAIDVVVRATGDKERVFLYKNKKRYPCLPFL